MLLLVLVGTASISCVCVWVCAVANNIPQAAVSVVARLQPALPALPSWLLLLVGRYACSSSGTSSRPLVHLGRQQQACQQVFVASWLLCWWRHKHAPGILQVCWLVLVRQLLHGVCSGSGSSSSLLAICAGSTQQLQRVRSLALLRGRGRKLPPVLLVCAALAVLLLWWPVCITTSVVQQQVCLCCMLLTVWTIVVLLLCSSNCSGLIGLEHLWQRQHTGAAQACAGDM
jgi:hypothetical protein